MTLFPKLPSSNFPLATVAILLLLWLTPTRVQAQSSDAHAAESSASGTTRRVQRPKEYTIYNVHFFDGPALPLAKAIKRQRIHQLKMLLAAKTVDVNYQDPRWQASLLDFAVSNRRYRAAKTLLKLGADPNQQSERSADSPLMLAADLNTSRYLELLLKYRGNANDISSKGIYQGWKTPLSVASCRSLENVKVLIKAGADPNYFKFSPNSVFTSALNAALISEKLDVVDFLVFEMEVDVDKPYLRPLNGDTLWISDALRSWTFPLDSKQYQFKLKLIDYLKTKGIDYRLAPIRERELNRFPKEYLDKY